MFAKSRARRNASLGSSSRWSGRLLLAIVVAFAVFLLFFGQEVWPTQAGPAQTIDTFGKDQNVTKTGIGSAFGAVNDAASIIGTNREVTATVTVGGGSLSVKVNTAVVGHLSHSQESGVRGSTLITYDGNADGGAAGLDPDGLGTVNLEAGGDNAFIVGVRSSDHAGPLTITFYSGNSTTTCSSLTKAMPILTSSDLPRAVVFRYSEFTPGSGCSSAANKNAVGAITVFIDGTASANEDWDITIDLIETDILDYGDLPGADPDYANTLLGDNGAGHVVGSTLYLGSTIDGEADGQESSNADGDDNGDTDDEDGVVPTTGFSWHQGENGGKVTVTVFGSGCLNGWIDWDQNGYFWHYQPGTGFVWDEDEYIIQNATTGSGDYTFDVPVDPGGKTFYARFRMLPQKDSSCVTLDPEDGDGAKGQYLSGEVEDYQWGFDPTAVTLTRLDATSSPSRSPIGVAAPVLAVLTGSVAIGGVLMRRRRVR
jgi:hypothetical protein